LSEFSQDIVVFALQIVANYTNPIRLKSLKIRGQQPDGRRFRILRSCSRRGIEVIVQLIIMKNLTADK
jgi:hypothetical protein